MKTSTRKQNHAPTRINHLLPLALAISLALPQTAFAGGSDQKYTAPLKPGVPYVFVVHQGRSIKVERDVFNSFRAHMDIRGALMQTSGTCPPFCIQPLQLDMPVETVAETEIVDFMLTTMRDNNGVLVDVRHPETFNGSTIPGSINLFARDLVQKSGSSDFDAILEGLGAKRRGETGWLTQQLETLGLTGNGLRTADWDFTEAKVLIVWGTSATSRPAVDSIRVLLEAGYPASKLKWYRGGMAAWQYWGFTRAGTPKR